MAETDFVNLTGDSSGDEEPDNPPLHQVVVAPVAVKKEAGSRFKPKAVRRRSVPSASEGPRPAASCTGSTACGAPGTSSRRSDSQGSRPAPPSSTPPAAHQTGRLLLLPQAELPSASCCGGAPAPPLDTEEPGAERGGAASSDESPASSVGEATAETTLEPTEVHDGQDDAQDPPSSTNTAVPPPPTIEELDAKGVAEHLPVQYTGGETEQGETWEDPRRLPWLVFDYKGGCRLKLRGSDLYKEGDHKFDLNSYATNDEEEYTMDDILACFRVGDKELYLVKWANYELNPLHCASFITELETEESDDEAPDAAAGVDLLERYKSRCEETRQPEVIDVTGSLMFCEFCTGGHLLFDKAMDSEELDGLQGAKKSRKKGKGASKRKGKEPVPLEDDSADESYDNGSEDEESSDDSDFDEPPRKRRRMTKKERLDEKKAKKKRAEYDAEHTVDCPSKLVPPEKPDEHAPYFLVEQVENRSLAGNESNYQEIMRDQLSKSCTGLKIVRTNSGKEGFSLALRQRIFMTNITGHLPTEEYVTKAKAGALPDVLKERLVVRPLASLIGWEAKDASSNPEDEWPAWFRESQKDGLFQCIKGREKDSIVQLESLQKWQKDMAVDGTVPDHLRFSTKIKHEGCKCTVIDERISCPCALRKVRAHGIVPCSSAYPRGRVRALKDQEALEAQGFPPDLFEKYGDANLDREGGKKRRELIGNSFQVNDVARMLSPKVEAWRPKLEGDGIIVLSLCDGIGGAIHALGKLKNMKVKAYIFAEKDKAARNITESYLKAEWKDTARYPLESVEELNDEKLKDNHPGVYDLLIDVDLVIFGPPCNDISSANRNCKGITHGDKSSVFFQCAHVLDSIKERRYLATIDHLEERLGAQDEAARSTPDDAAEA